MVRRSRRIRTTIGDPWRTDIAVTGLDVSVARERIGVKAAVTLRDGVRRTLRHHGIDVGDRRH